MVRGFTIGEKLSIHLGDGNQKLKCGLVRALQSTCGFEREVACASCRQSHACSHEHGGMPACALTNAAAVDLNEGQKRNHTASFSVFAAVAVVPVCIGGGAAGAIMHGGEAGFAALADDVGGEIQFVIGRADAGAELGDDVGTDAAVIFHHRLNGGGDDAELGAFFSTVDAADGAAHGIHEPHGAAVGDVDAEADSRIVGDEAVHAGNWRGVPSFHGGDGRAVDLFGGEKFPRARADGAADFLVMDGEACECRGAIHLHIQPRNAACECVQDRERGERGECLERAAGHCGLFRIPEDRAGAAENSAGGFCDQLRD